MCNSCESGGKPIGAIWWRVSTKGQAEISPETQIDAGKSLLELSGFAVAEEYIIGRDWSSLEILECPEMNTLLNWVRRGEIHAVAVYHTDRLAGEPSQRLPIKWEFDKYGVQPLAKFGQFFEGEWGDAFEALESTVKKLQVLRAQQGARDGLHDRAVKLGLPTTGRSPFGYSFAEKKDAKSSIVLDYTRLIPNKDFRTASLIWSWAVEGVSLRQMVKMLYERGIKTATGKDIWAGPTLSSILHNPVYAGKFHALRYESVTPKVRKTEGYGKRGKLKDRNEWVLLDGVNVGQSIVTQEEFDYVQAKLASNKTNAKRNTKNEYLLRGMIHCEIHNGRFNARRQKRWDYNVYICNIFYKQPSALNPCKRKSLGAWIEQDVWNKAVSLLSDPDAVLGELYRRQQSKEEAERHTLGSLNDIEKRLARGDDDEMKLTSWRLAGEVSDTVLKRQMALINAERTWCTEEKHRLVRQLEQIKQRFATVIEVKELSDRIGHRLKGASFQDKRFVLEALETRVSVTAAGEVKVTFSIPMPSSEKTDADEAIVLKTPWSRWR